MKKTIVLSLVLVFACASVSLAAKKAPPKKTSPAKPTYSQPAATAAPTPKSSGFVISPKLGMMGGISSSLGVGCEFAMPIMQSVDGMAELWYVPGSGWSMIGVSANGVYKFPPMEGTPFNFYAGGGLLYDMINISSWAAVGGNISAFGFQVFGGADYPIPGAGVAFGQIKYALANSTYNYNFGGFAFSQSVNTGGLGIEGGYRFYL